MYKIEINVSGEVKHMHSTNKHEDDVIGAWPSLFTEKFGVEITKDDITIYKIDESKVSLINGLLNVNVDALVDVNTVGEIKVKKVKKAKYVASQMVLETEYNKEVVDTEKSYKNAKTKPNFAGGKKPKKKKHDFGEGLKDAIEIAADDILANDIVSEELVLTGTPLNKWPYDEDGKFLGNN